MHASFDEFTPYIRQVHAREKYASISKRLRYL